LAAARLAGLSAPRLALALALLALLAAWPASAADIYHGQVERIIDGDTVSVLTTDYERLRVRLYGIDTPEGKQAWGGNARQALASMIDGRDVELQVEDVDRYSRQVGLIWLDGVNINLRLVEEGHAWVYERYCKIRDVCRAMGEAQRRARSQGLGLWADPDPVAPWDFRRGGR
jgi:endonuclease YncB( thermonuclease family)